MSIDKTNTFSQKSASELFSLLTVVKIKAKQAHRMNPNSLLCISVIKKYRLTESLSMSSLLFVIQQLKFRSVKVLQNQGNKKIFLSHFFGFALAGFSELVNYFSPCNNSNKYVSGRMFISFFKHIFS